MQIKAHAVSGDLKMLPAQEKPAHVKPARKAIFISLISIPIPLATKAIVEWIVFKWENRKWK